jgi:hypothetical protein
MITDNMDGFRSRDLFHVANYDSGHFRVSVSISKKLFVCHFHKALIGDVVAT